MENKKWSREDAEQNKNKILEYNKQYFELNKEHLTEKIKCDCGCMIRRSNISHHRNTKKHLKLMNE